MTASGWPRGDFVRALEEDVQAFLVAAVDAVEAEPHVDHAEADVVADQDALALDERNLVTLHREHLLTADMEEGR